MPIGPSDVALNKAAIVERCIRRLGEEYAADPDLEACTHIDAMTLNIARACQACIDLAMHLVAPRRLGMPQSSGEAFALLRAAGLIPASLDDAMRRMTGFRHIAIHQYKELDNAVLRYIAERGWRDLVAYCEALGLRVEADRHG